MHTHETEPIETNHEPASLGATAKLVAERASTLVRLELELAALELKRKASALAVGIGLAAGAALFLLYALGFGFAAAAAGIATALPWWSALLIVFGLLFVIALILGAIAAMMFSRGTPPVPEQAIEEAKLTQEALRSDGNG
jgi:putative superfamily III holin-X